MFREEDNVVDETRGLLEHNVVENKTERPEHKEGWLGWLVVACSFTCICILDGIGYSFGVFLEPLLEEFEEGRGALSIAGSLQVGVYSLSGPMVAAVVGKWGERKACMVGAIISAAGVLGASYAVGIKTLILCYSVVTGLGFGLMYLPSIVIVSQHFTRRRSLATGIVLCAAGAGTFLLAPFTEQMVEHMGWRGAMRVLAGACLGCVGCGAAMVPGHAVQEDPVGTVHDSIGVDRKVQRPCLAKVIGIELSSSPNLSVMMLMIFGDCLSACSLYIPYTHLPPAAMAVGISPSNAAFLISAIGVTNTVGRVVAGWLADKPNINPMLLIMVAIMAASPTHYIFSLTSSYWLFLLLSCIFGFLTGVWVSTMPTALVHLLGVSLLAPSFGIITAFRGAMVLSGPPVAGLLVDMVGVKGAAMVMSGVTMTVSSVFYMLAVLVHKRERGQYDAL